MGGGTGTKGGYKVGKNEDAEGMCTSVASLEPDPRYSGCCSSIFRPGRVLRDIVVGSLVVIAIAVVIAVVFVVCFFFIPLHHVPEASQSEATVIPTTHSPSDREGSDLPPLFEVFSHRTPTEEHIEHTPEGSEGTLKELVVPHEHQTEEPHQQAEAHPEEVHGVVVDEATQEAPQGECQPRQLEMCSDLPHGLTAFPNWAGDQTEEDMQKTSLPFLRDVIVRSRCSPRAKEYSCAILEPPCTPEGTILPPCRTFCKSVASTCQEFITSRFSLSSAFDCDKFPDSSDPSVCFDMTHDSVPADNTTTVMPTPEEAEGTEATLLETTTLAEEAENTTASHCPELQCLDGTCISLSQVNDGVVDCPEGIDEEDFGGII